MWTLTLVIALLQFVLMAAVMAMVVFALVEFLRHDDDRGVPRF